MNTDIEYARKILVAVKRNGLYAHNVIQASHERTVFEATNRLPEWRENLRKAAILDGLPENKLP